MGDKTTTTTTDFISSSQPSPTPKWVSYLNFRRDLNWNCPMPTHWLPDCLCFLRLRIVLIYILLIIPLINSIITHEHKTFQCYIILKSTDTYPKCLSLNILSTANFKTNRQLHILTGANIKCTQSPFTWPFQYKFVLIKSNLKFLPSS